MENLLLFESVPIFLLNNILPSISTYMPTSTFLSNISLITDGERGLQTIKGFISQRETYYNSRPHNLIPVSNRLSTFPPQKIIAILWLAKFPFRTEPLSRHPPLHSVLTVRVGQNAIPYQFLHTNYTIASLGGYVDVVIRLLSIVIA